MPASDDWPGVFELDLLAVETRLNDPRTLSVCGGNGNDDGVLEDSAALCAHGNGNGGNLTELRLEIRLTDPRTVSVMRPPRAAPPENATTTPRRDVVDLLGRADG